MKKIDCILCRKPLSNGIIILGKGICRECEKKIVESDINSEDYNIIEEKIKNSIVKTILERNDIGWKNYRF